MTTPYFEIRRRGRLVSRTFCMSPDMLAFVGVEAERGYCTVVAF